MSVTGSKGALGTVDSDKTSAAGRAWPSGELYSVTNLQTGGRITVAQDLSPSRLVLYATGQAICVEPFVNVDVAPGGAVTWTTTYTFAGTPGR